MGVTGSLLGPVVDQALCLADRPLQRCGRHYLGPYRDADVVFDQGAELAVSVNITGRDLLDHTRFNRWTAFADQERLDLRLLGLLPFLGCGIPSSGIRNAKSPRRRSGHS